MLTGLSLDCTRRLFETAGTLPKNRDKSRRLPNRSTLGPEEKMEWVERIQKPTTSCANRKCCALVADPDLRKYRHVRFSQNIVVSPARLDEILVRVRASTASTSKNYEQCLRLSCNANRCTQNNNLALVSGLSRSHCVNDIVDRLYRPVVYPTCRTKM